MPTFSPSTIKLSSGHRIRRKKYNNNNKNPKLQLCRLHVPLEALYFVVGGLIVPPKENAVCTAAILDFFVMSSTPEVVKTHLSCGHEPQ